MAHLIIGHTTETTARIWVRGDTACTCTVVLNPPGASVLPKALSGETDFTGVIEVSGLTAGKSYVVHASFSSNPPKKISGRFQTFPQLPANQESSFSFVLSSCNLSVVSINNFVARLIATVGAQTALTSLDLPLQRWREPRFTWLRGILRGALKFILRVAASSIERTTGIKQPGPPYIRSPFLKLSAIFDSWVLDLDEVTSRPTVGERIYVQGGASGVVACSPTVKTEKKDGRRDGTGKIEHCKLVLTALEGTFKAGDRVYKQAQTASDDEKEPPSFLLGTIKEEGSVPGKRWYTPPSFFIHAGDQIYYDFPDIDRQPDRNDYRLAYREAWFNDVANRHLLSHWPQYMTLDDHEIADQFALDFKPRAKVLPDVYLKEATVAYREYVQASSPGGGLARTASGPYRYHFNKGLTRFFVLDTRTQRDTSKSQIIGADQMRHLLDWMTCYRNDLKFVVTSVPFIAKISDTGSEETLRWTTEPGARRNEESDKWSARQFTAQRDLIIEHIAEENIQRLIFLTGDMHCCYHASMRIAATAKTSIRAETKYESVIVHELAGGPVNQLQLANAAEFDRHCTGKTSREFAYETMLDRLHGQVNAVMHLKVEYVEREQTTALERTFAPEVEWNVIRTLTDTEAADWPIETNPAEPSASSPESVMNGRISFVETRKPDALSRWARQLAPFNG